MLLQRQYCDGKCTHMVVKHTGTHDTQNFSHRIVETGLIEGWISIRGNQLTMKAEPQDLVYTLVREPGYYCISSGDRIPISPMAWARMRATPEGGDLSAMEARNWLAEHGKELNDYEVTQAYECVLNEAQHDRFRAVLDAKGRVVGAHQLEG